MNHDSYSDDYLRGILRGVRTIAMVGASEHWNRPSYFAMKYLQDKGYRVIPVNPQAKGEEILGEKVRNDLSEITEKIDMVDIFRRSDAVPPIVDQAIAKGVGVVWMQLGVRNDDAAAKAGEAGPQVGVKRPPHRR